MRTSVAIILGLGIALAGCGRPVTAEKPKPVTQHAPASATGSAVAKPKPAAGAKTAPTQPQAKQPPRIVLTQNDISLEWLDKGKLRMKAKAKEFRGSEVTKIGELIQFSAQLYENGVVTATISAPKATADTVKRIVVATGGVKMKSLQRSTSLTSERITWYANKGQVTGQGNVVINSTMGRITAAAFQADTGLRKFTVSGSAERGMQ